ncbi:MAG: hypothetical protein HYZ14_14160 [Bacteroidetes bacterium]|nr:hypothetical protein [Bacteroidota bacterium]
MKNYLPLFILFVLAGCQQTDQLTYTEKRVVGSWFYTDVDFTPRWGFKKDITKDYFGDVLTFKNDFTLVYENKDQGLTGNGVWQVNQVNTTNSGTNQNSWTDQVVASYENAATGEITQLIWDNFCVNKNRINAGNSDKDGYYTYELKKF